MRLKTHLLTALICFPVLSGVSSSQSPSPPNWSFLEDADQDGMTDFYEILLSMDPLDPTDGLSDLDGDGLSLAWEYSIGTNPWVADTDADGWSDSEEYLLYNTDPVSWISFPFSSPPASGGTPGPANPPVAASATPPPPPPSLGNGEFSVVNFTTWNNSLGSTSYQNGGFKWGAGAIGGWTAYVGSTVEVWEVGTERFIELDGSAGNYGVKQPIANVRPGGYALSWRQCGRTHSSAGSDPYKVKIYYMNGANEVTLSLSPLYAGFSKTQWTDNALGFHITPSQIAAAGTNPIYVAYVPLGSMNSYGTLIDKVELISTDLDIVHPATGDVDEKSEDSSSAYVEKNKGGLVAIRRNTETPLTKLIMRAFTGLPATSKFRLDNNSTLISGHVNIWRDQACTQAVISQQTEFDLGQDVTLYLEGVDEGIGGDLVITQEFKVNGIWHQGDNVSIKVVHAEIPVVLRAFIPHVWTQGEAPFPVSYIQLVPVLGGIMGFSTALGGDRQEYSLKSYDDENYFRLRQEVIMTPYREIHQFVYIDSEKRAESAPLTRYYDRSEDIPEADQEASFGEAFVPNAQPNWPFVPPSPTATYENASRDGDATYLTVSLSGEPGTPWFIPEGLFPNIDTSYRIKMVRMESGSNPFIRVSMDVTHDLYPAYEAIVGKADGVYLPVYQSMPPPEILPGPVSVGTSMEDHAAEVDIH